MSSDVIRSEREPLTDRQIRDVRRRTLVVLMVAVALGGAGTGGAISTVVVLAEEITGSELLSGTAAAGLAAGGALSAVPLAKLMARRGRQVGLRSGYLLALAGSLGTLLGAVLGSYPLVFAGVTGVGVGSACGLASRFAVADLAAPDERPRMISFLLAANIGGGIAGPTLALGPAVSVSTALGLGELAGPFLFAAVAFGLAILVVGRGLRPDPLLLARRLGGTAEVVASPRTLRHSLATIVRVPGAGLATAAMMVGESVMVSLMVMMPLHMTEGEQELRVVGFVVSAHVLGMFALSPLVGWATAQIGPIFVEAAYASRNDRLIGWVVGHMGPMAMVAVGGLVCFAGAEIAAHTPADVAWGMFVGMFVVGLGWNCCLVAGSALRTAVVPESDRVPVQGAADLLITASGTLAGVAAGAVMAWQDFRFLSHYSGVLGAVLAGAAALAFLRDTGKLSRAAPAGRRTGNDARS